MKSRITERLAQAFFFSFKDLIEADREMFECGRAGPVLTVQRGDGIVSKTHMVVIERCSCYSS